jgi:hypothetical protein
MRVTAKLKILLWIVLLAIPVSNISALTFNELKQTPRITPEKLAAYFKDFAFKFHEEVQDPDVFLATKSGDCDDFATLAAAVLSKNGYTPKLVAIRMKGETHVVCYVAECKGYLDYNFRADSHPIIPCSGSLPEIAKKVAESFGRDWIATYEFTFRGGVKRLVDNILTNSGNKA